MDGLPTHLLRDPDALIALLQKQQREIDSLLHTLTRKDQTLAHRVKHCSTEKTSSETLNRDQFQLFDEAELLAEFNLKAESDSTEIKGHLRQKVSVNSDPL